MKMRLIFQKVRGIYRERRQFKSDNFVLEEAPCLYIIIKVALIPNFTLDQTLRLRHFCLELVVCVIQTWRNSVDFYLVSVHLVEGCSSESPRKWEECKQTQKTWSICLFLHVHVFH